MEKIYLSDITMKQRDKDSYITLSFREKLELAKILDKLGVDIIEFDNITLNKADALLIKSVASVVNNATLAVSVNPIQPEVGAIWESIEGAKNKRLQVEAPVSTVQMEYIYHKKPDAMLECISNSIMECKKYIDDVEFVALDATRSDYDFLCKAINIAIDEGAKTITLCDNAGAFLPDELYDFLVKLQADVEQLKNVNIGVYCSNSLAMADACALAATRAGIREIKVSAHSDDTTSLGNISTLFTRREDVCGVECNVKTTGLKKGLEQIDNLFQIEKSKVSPLVNGTKDDFENIALTYNDDRNTVFKAVKMLGYDLNDDDKNRVWDAFCSIAMHKQSVGARELEAIIASNALQVPTAYVLEGYVISASSSLGATAHIKLNYNGKQMDGISAGDGPIDASYLAIERCIGSKCELDDFQIRALTEGREAMGEAITKLRCNGKLYSGRGISTDITEASIKAYINALNKIAFEEEM